MNQKGPNSQIDVDQFSTGIKNVFNTIEHPSITNILGTPGQELRKRSELLSQMVNNLNKPILKALANDMLTTMVSWLDDPQVLCCLIQGIWSSYVAKNVNLSASSKIKLADSDFGKFLDNLIAFVDFIIIFITQDIRRLVIFIPDLIKEIMNAIMGMIILLIQETAFALRNSVLSVIFEWMDKWDTERTWSKCLPLKQMINILKKYISDYGILATIFEKIKGYISGLSIKSEKIAKELVPNVKDLEFLYWLRDLLIKLKRASLNFDLCIDYDFLPTSDTINTNNDENNQKFAKKTYIDEINDENKDFQGDIKKQQGYTIGSDGTIFIDKDNTLNDNGNWIPRLSNSFLREFIHKEYSIPYDVIDNTITRGTSKDNIQGTSITSDNFIIQDRCANTPTSQETIQWILNLRSRLNT
ncbi:MAG: hypothetical protein M0R17_05435 [Candidatus Omnitrophica bacterium]|jgi:hypothetical protein|nr:hypothetical protein [Candidatus Omnitrophota bacterium]